MLLLPDDLNAASVRDYTNRLLFEEPFRLAAQTEQRPIESMPLPSAVVPLLEAFAANGPT